MLSKKKAERLLKQSVEEGVLAPELQEELLRQSVEHGELAPEAVPVARFQLAWERFEGGRLGALAMIAKVVASAGEMVRLVVQEARRQRRVQAARRRRAAFPRAAAARLVGGAGLVIGASWIVCAPDTAPPIMEVQVQQVEPEDTEVPEVFTSGHDAGVIGKPMPKKRMKGQQPPPCEPPPLGQVELNGACWVPVQATAPCGKFYENTGRCYAPVPGDDSVPTSLEP